MPATTPVGTDAGERRPDQDAALVARLCARDRRAVEEDRSELLPSSDATPEERSGETRSREALAAAIGVLSATHRAVVNLTYYQGFGYREIAEIMDCPVDTVKTRMFHARRHLKQSLAGDLADWL